MNGGQDVLPIARQMLDLLIPMNIVFDADGVIHGVGPLVHTLVGPQTGAHISDLIIVRRPETAAEADALLKIAGRRLIIELRLPPDEGQDGSGQTETETVSGPAAPAEAIGPEREPPSPRPPQVCQRLLGVVVPLPDGRGLLQLAFGTDLAQAVEAHNLTIADFSPIDNVTDVLYLLEAQGLVRREMEALMDRLERARQSAERDAETDRLTGIGNRRAMDRGLRSVAQKDPQSGFAIMHLDLDKFKQINDTLGHAAGDAVLAAVARVLREETRDNDLVCRIGGDEFIVLLPDCSEPDFLAEIAQRIIDRFEEPVTMREGEIQASVSIGIALSADYEELDIDRILSDADAALYQSKNAGRGCFHFHTHGTWEAAWQGTRAAPD